MKIILKMFMILSVLFSLPMLCSDQTAALTMLNQEQIQVWVTLVDASGISRIDYAKMSRSDMLQKLTSTTSSSTLKRDALCQLIAFEDKHPYIACCKRVAQQNPEKLDSLHAEVSKEQKKEDAKKRFDAMRAELQARSGRR